MLGLCIFVVLLIASPKPWNIAKEGISEPKLRDLIAAYSWWAMAANVAVLAILAGLCPWWSGSKFETSHALKLSYPRWFWPLVGVAMVVSAAFAAQRLNHGLWGDEEYALRRAVVGAYKMDKDGLPYLSHLKWRDTAYSYKKPTNHILYSLLAKVSLGAASLGIKRDSLSDLEWAYRLPAFIAGVASIGALAWMMAEYGFFLAGVTSAFLLALHPWHLRYASEARGYSLVLLLVPLLLVLAKRGIDTGRWFYWGLYGLIHFLLLYTWPGTLYLLLILNLGLLFLFCTRLVPTNCIGRWFACLAIAAMVVIQLMFPLVPQIHAYLATAALNPAKISPDFLVQISGYLTLGATWKQTGDGTYPELFWHVFPKAGGAIFFAVAAAGLMALGLWRFAKRSPMNFVATCTLVISPLLAVLHAYSRNLPIFEWYLIYGILGVCAFLSLGADALGTWISKFTPTRHIAPFPCVGLVVVYFAFSQPIRAWHLQHPIEPTRESVLSTRASLKPNDPRQADTITLSFVNPPNAYDAHVIVARSPESFFELLRKADAEEKPLYVNIGHAWASAHECPVQWAAVNDPNLFEDPLIFRGLDSSLDRFVYRYRPGTVQTYPENLPAGIAPVAP